MPEPPDPPVGMTTSEFGRRVMRWGQGDEQARERMATLTLEELQSGGVTGELARLWRDFYRREKARRPMNPSAEGRADLMLHAVELLGGGQ